MYDGDARVEVSGATTANWVAKSANLLADGLGAPERVGLLLPLHWQAVALLLAGVAAGAQVVVAADPEHLAGCDAAFVLAEHAAAALDAGVDDVVALSGHPLGLPAPGLPPMVLDYAREVPSYGDHYGGGRPGAARIEVGGEPVRPLPGIEPDARVLTCLDPADPAGAAVLLATLSAGASLVLLRSGDATRVAAAEHATATAGIHVEGLTRWV
ncbi:MAG: hypothetical protein QOE05_3721 [Actinomycetota bacterium]|jgi:uncharacterized protein (TIGR03089 family)|nr:hypothetical protein [Actinomycetota bacterium]